MAHRNPLPPLSRREALSRIGAGFDTLGLASMLNPIHAAAVDAGSPLAPKAKRIIQLFMPGGPSQVDTFDYKPPIAKHQGQRPGLLRAGEQSS